MDGIARSRRAQLGVARDDLPDHPLERRVDLEHVFAEDASNSACERRSYQRRCIGASSTIVVTSASAKAVASSSAESSVSTISS